MTPRTQPLSELLGAHVLAPLAWSTAWRAARFLADERPSELEIDTKSSPTDAVSQMDRGAENRIIEAILSERPDDAILGEEGGERPGSSDVRWVVDPLDGTVNYLYGLPMWGVSIAAEVGGRTEVGVVVTPALGEAFIGIRGAGAWSIRDDIAAPIRVNGCQSLGQALIATGFAYQADTRIRQGSVVRDLLGAARDIRRSGSAIVDFTWLARGWLDGYFESGLNAWDIAAGALIAQEAGAHVTGLHTDDPTNGVMVAATPGVAQALIAELRRLNAA